MMYTLCRDDLSNKFNAVTNAFEKYSTLLKRRWRYFSFKPRTTFIVGNKKIDDLLQSVCFNLHCRFLTAVPICNLTINLKRVFQTV